MPYYEMTADPARLYAMRIEFERKSEAEKKARLEELGASAEFFTKLNMFKECIDKLEASKLNQHLHHHLSKLYSHLLEQTLANNTNENIQEQTSIILLDHFTPIVNRLISNSEVVLPEAEARKQEVELNKKLSNKSALITGTLVILSAMVFGVLVALACTPVGFILGSMIGLAAAAGASMDVVAACALSGMIIGGSMAMVGGAIGGSILGAVSGSFIGRLFQPKPARLSPEVKHEVNKVQKHLN